MYRIVKCPYCKRFQMTTANKTFRCNFCHKSRVLHNLRVLFESEIPQPANQVLMKIKEEKFKVNEYNKGLDEFQSADLDNYL